MICQYLQTWTAQQVFDKVVDHLRKQDKHSLFFEGKPEETCAYRGDNGRMCAAGCLIPDIEYTADIENKTWDILVESKHVPSAHEDLIKALQRTHDWSLPFDWEKGFRDNAAKFNLTYVPPHVTA